MNILEKLTLLEKESDDFGFKWSHYDQIINQIKNECLEIQEVIEEPTMSHHLQEEIGDLIHATFSLCLFCKFPAEETLNISLKKFEKRLNEVKRITLEKGHENLQGQSFKELMAVWDQAKERVG